MARPVILSNGQLMVGLDEHGLVHDFYYPYVGLENLTTARSLHHKIGVWVDGAFSWVDDVAWDKKIDFTEDALISDITMTNELLGIRLHFSDYVDTENNGFVRHVSVTNQSGTRREVRVFMHQVFQISREGHADTALYVPDEHYILTYKGRFALLAYAQRSADGHPFDQFAVGNYQAGGNTGTYIDAEDGELSGNTVEHGGVDSIVRVSLDIDAHATEQVDYWIIAASSQAEAEKIHTQYCSEGISTRLQTAQSQWQEWISASSEKINRVNPKYRPFLKKSLMLIKAHQDKRGGILASGDSSIYNYGKDYYCYCWPRDGAYAMWPLIRLGYFEEPKKFFEFCRDTITQNGYLMHKYQPDKAVGSTWHPMVRNGKTELAIQEDETAIVVCMLGEYLEASGDEEFVTSLFETFIRPAAEFMSRFIDEETNLPHASYDLWEEKFLTTSYTSFVVVNALKTASTIAERFGYPDESVNWKAHSEKIEESLSLLFNIDTQSYRKGLFIKSDGSLEFDNTIDSSSLYGAMMFGSGKIIGDASIKGTADAVKSYLENTETAGGFVRYTNDRYMATPDNQLGNPWFVCSLWYAQYCILTGKLETAQQIVDSCVSLALPSGIFSEQVDPSGSKKLGVAPLVWSHAEFINTVLDLSKK
jgi:GH15 family glucan-1,4-alpha-glucosidase